MPMRISQFLFRTTNPEATALLLRFYKCLYYQFALLVKDTAQGSHPSNSIALQWSSL